MPFHNLALQTTLPDQFNQPDPIATLLRLDSDLRLSSNRIPEILIEAQPAARDRRVSTCPEVHVRLAGLMRLVESLVPFCGE